MNKINKLIATAGIGIPLVFYGCSPGISTKENPRSFQRSLEVPESVRVYQRNLTDSPLNDKPVLVRLSEDVDTYIVTSRNGYHLNVLAEYAGIESRKSGEYLFDFDVGFSSIYDRQLRRASNNLDTNNDRVIDLSELSEFIFR